MSLAAAETDPRGAALAAFVAAAGRDPGGLTPLAGDASNRRYLRLADGAGRAVVMDAPPERGEDVRPFLAVTAALRDRALSAPEVLAADPEAGFLLLEDLGDRLFARVCEAAPAEEAGLYAAAVDLLAARLDAPPPLIGEGPAEMELAPYDMGQLLREARLATEWYLAGATGLPTPDFAAEYEGLMAEALAGVAADRSALVLRDYHAENLLWLPERDGPAAVGLLDYQDALAGHPAYDLVSLLEDARRDTSDALQEAMVARFLAQRRDLDPGAFRAAYAALGAQRNLKIVGIFARLAIRDGKPRYLSLIPRVWAHLVRDLSHARLDRLRALVLGRMPAPDPGVLARIAGGARR